MRLPPAQFEAFIEIVSLFAFWEKIRDGTRRSVWIKHGFEI